MPAAQPTKLLTLVTGFALSAALCPAQDKILRGQGQAGDWQSDAPDVQHRIVLSDLPPEYAAPSAFNAPRIVPPPKGASPKVPKGFEVELFAGGLANPRYLRAAPNGDIFVTESSGRPVDTRHRLFGASVNERDGLGDDLVPDYMTRVREGGDTILANRS